MVNASLIGVNLLLSADQSSLSHPLTSRHSQVVVSWHWRLKNKGLAGKYGIYSIYLRILLCDYYFVPPTAVFAMGSSPSLHTCACCDLLKAHDGAERALLIPSEGGVTLPAQPHPSPCEPPTDPRDNRGRRRHRGKARRETGALQDEQTVMGRRCHHQHHPVPCPDVTCPADKVTCCMIRCSPIQRQHLWAGLGLLQRVPEHQGTPRGQYAAWHDRSAGTASGCSQGEPHVSVPALENLHLHSHSSRDCSEKKTNMGGHRL